MISYYLYCELYILKTSNFFEIRYIYMKQLLINDVVREH